MHPVLIDLGLIKLHSYGLLTLLGTVLAWTSFLLVIRRQWPSEIREKAQPRQLSVYALAVSVFQALAGIVAYSQWRRDRSNHYYLFLWVIPLLILVGDIASRAGWALFERDGLLHLFGGGRIYTVGIIAALAAAITLAALRYFPFWRTADVLMPSILVSMAVGRIGCFMAGCCWGTECSGFGCVSFPPEALVSQSLARSGMIEVGEHSPLLHPVQLYLSAGLALVALLGFWGEVRGPKFPGQIGILTFVGFQLVDRGAGWWRGDRVADYVGRLSTSAIVAFLLIAAALVIYAILWARRAR